MEYTCILCPRGCHLTAEKVMEEGKETIKVSGNFCPRGIRYATEEMTMPMRTVTTSLYVEGGDMKMVSMKTAAPVPKERIPQVLEAAAKAQAKAPLKVGDAILKNVAETGTDLIATRNVAAARG
mgnify:CR=1 FL=1